jgi:hypothetical protein
MPSPPKKFPIVPVVAIGGAALLLIMIMVLKRK